MTDANQSFTKAVEHNVERLRRELSNAIDERNSALLESHGIAPPDEYFSTWPQNLGVRNDFIGGSDIAAIVGEHPTMSNLTVFLDKTGQGVPFDGGEFVEWGHRLEAPILDAWAEANPDVIVAHMKGTWKHPDIPYLGASPDGLVFGDSRGLGVLEAKNVSVWFQDEWEDDTPARNIVQVLHNASVLGATWCEVVGLIGGNELRRFKFEVADCTALVAAFQTQCSAFWKYVALGEAPPAQLAHQATKKELALVNPADFSRDEIELTDDGVLDALAIRPMMAKEVKEAQVVVDECDNIIRQALGTATIGTVNGLDVVSWKPNRTFDEALIEPEWIPQYQKFDVAAFRKANPAMSKKMMVEASGDDLKSRVLRYKKPTTKKETK